MSQINEKIHPYRFALWVGIGSIIMMFAAFTSAYIVRHNQPNWQEFSIPVIFRYSTLVILISSGLLYFAKQTFADRRMRQYRQLITATGLLGLLFIVLQTVGFIHLKNNNIKIFGDGSNPSVSFLAVICGVHMLHVLGGVITLIILFFKSFSTSQKTYTILPLELTAIYWNFVDLLWLYLYGFFLIINR